MGKKLNLLGIDFEDWYHPELIKKYHRLETYEPIVVNAIDKIIDWLHQNDTYATFFVVGELLEFKPELLDKIIDNAALREIRKSKKDTKPQSYPEVNNSAIDNKWNISSPKKSTKVVTCNSCHSLNEGDTNYCGACGNYLS